MGGCRGWVANQDLAIKGRTIAHRRGVKADLQAQLGAERRSTQRPKIDRRVRETGTGGGTDGNILSVVPLADLSSVTPVPKF